MLAIILALAGTATALAAGTKAKLKLKGPSGTLAAGTPYTVTATGKATSKANTLFAYEGGQVGSGTAAITCYATEKAEYAHYKTSATVHVFLGHSHVHGHFSKSWAFAAIHPGPRSFCAYLANSSGHKTYAHAALHWTNGS